MAGTRVALEKQVKRSSSKIKEHTEIRCNSKAESGDRKMIEVE
jgi:hypothetical protein